MPLPKPKANEERANFLGRCMIHDTSVEDFENRDQRFAVCVRQWEQGAEKNRLSSSDEVSKRVEKSLETKLEDHREKVGEETQLAETFNDYPKKATENAQKVLRWRDEHGDEVKGMTAVGWRRANQLAKREKVSRRTIARMASFKRHQKNAEISPEFKSTPWKDRGYVAWLGWGGTSGVEWAIRKLREIDNSASFRMSKNYTFQIATIEEAKVDQEAGVMKGVSLISVGEALGHDIYVDQSSIETILEQLEGEKLPAYITHTGALFEDRLTREIGIFEDFRVEGDRLLGNFRAFKSFKSDDSKTFNRLFELAEELPERFGLSIVFEAESMWSTPDGDVPMGRWPNNDSDRLYDENNAPENALFDFPSIRVVSVTSADFVDQPAANERGLFSSKFKTSKKMTKAELIELNESLETENKTLAEEVEESKAKEIKNADSIAAVEAEKEALQMTSEEMEQKIGSLEEEVEAIKEAHKAIEEANKSIESEKEQMEADMKELEETKEKAASEHEEEMKIASDALAKDADRIKILESLIRGSSPVVALGENDESYTPSASSRKKMISEYAKKNNVSEFTATITLSKQNPEIFSK